MSIEHSPARAGSSAASLLADYMDRPTLAAELNCSPRTIARYEKMPNGLASVSIGGRRLYRLGAVLDFIARREKNPNPTRTGA